MPSLFQRRNFKCNFIHVVKIVLYITWSHLIVSVQLKLIKRNVGQKLALFNPAVCEQRSCLDSRIKCMDIKDVSQSILLYEETLQCPYSIEALYYWKILDSPVLFVTMKDPDKNNRMRLEETTFWDNGSWTFCCSAAFLKDMREMEILSREQRLLAPLLNLKIKLYSIIKLITVKSKYLQQLTIYVRLPTLNN